MALHKETLSSYIHLEDARHVLRLYCCALSGRDVSVEALERLVEKNIGWSTNQLPTTDGATIYLPSIINKFATNAENSAFLRVILTCQLGHIEFGGFDFGFTRPSTKFCDLRPELSAARRQPGEKESAESAAEGVYATDMSRFFRLFPEPRLALDIFTTLENSRIEARIMSEYRGLAAAYRGARSEALGMRPEINTLPAREALKEFMIRISLGQTKGLEVPARHVQAATRISTILGLVAQCDAIVEDSAEATVRIYSLLSGAMNDQLAQNQFTTIELDRNEPAREQEKINREEALRPLLGWNKMPAEAYAPPKKVDYRGDFKHELTQLLTQFTAAKGAGIWARPNASLWSFCKTRRSCNSWMLTRKAGRARRRRTGCATISCKSWRGTSRKSNTCNHRPCQTATTRVLAWRPCARAHSFMTSGTFVPARTSPAGVSYRRSRWRMAIRRSTGKPYSSMPRCRGRSSMNSSSSCRKCTVK